jgi:hypothetical protein
MGASVGLQVEYITLRLDEMGGQTDSSTPGCDPCLRHQRPTVPIYVNGGDGKKLWWSYTEMIGVNE